MGEIYEILESGHPNEGQWDAISNPSHYNWHPSGVECKTIAEAFSYWLGNAIKYIWRAGRKNGDVLEDLKKARRCLDNEISRLERGRNG